MHILITNDDGIRAPGIAALADAMESLGHVTVIAPDRNWSTTGHIRIMDQPMQITKSEMLTGRSGYACSGSPSDCVAMGLRGFLDDPVDLVVSGINDGENVAQDLTYSGTVSAAMEAIVWRVPAIAFSLYYKRESGKPVMDDFQHAARWAAHVVEYWQNIKLSTSTLLNVNIPRMPQGEVNGIQLTRLGTRIYNTDVQDIEDPRGKKYYWAIGQAPEIYPEPGTDTGALSEGAISVTPVHLDMTDYDQLSQLQDMASTPYYEPIVQPRVPIRVVNKLK